PAGISDDHGCSDHLRPAHAQRACTDGTRLAGLPGESWRPASGDRPDVLADLLLLRVYPRLAAAAGSTGLDDPQSAQRIPGLLRGASDRREWNQQSGSSTLATPMTGATSGVPCGNVHACRTAASPDSRPGCSFPHAPAHSRSAARRKPTWP